MSILPSESNYSEWVDELYASPTEERVKQIEKTVSEFAGRSEEANQISDSFIDTKEFEKISLLGYLHYTPINSAVRKDHLVHLKFPKLVVAAKHKRLPLIMALSEKMPKTGSEVLIDRMQDSMGVKQALSYTKTLSRMTAAEKKELYRLIVDGIKTYRKESSKKEIWLSDYLMEGKDFSFMGFVANLPYINVDSKFGETKTFWVHAWGTPQLLFSHRRLPVIMIVGPSVRLDENVLGSKNMTGFTG